MEVKKEILTADLGSNFVKKCMLLFLVCMLRYINFLTISQLDNNSTGG